MACVFSSSSSSSSSQNAIKWKKKRERRTHHCMYFSQNFLVKLYYINLAPEKIEKILYICGQNCNRFFFFLVHLIRNFLLKNKLLYFKNFSTLETFFSNHKLKYLWNRPEIFLKVYDFSLQFVHIEPLVLNLPKICLQIEPLGENNVKAKSAEALIVDLAQSEWDSWHCPFF